MKAATSAVHIYRGLCHEDRWAYTQLLCVALNHVSICARSASQVTVAVAAAEDSIELCRELLSSAPDRRVRGLACIALQALAFAFKMGGRLSEADIAKQALSVYARDADHDHDLRYLTVDEVHTTRSRTDIYPKAAHRWVENPDELDRESFQFTDGWCTAPLIQHVDGAVECSGSQECPIDKKIHTTIQTCDTQTCVRAECRPAPR